MHEYSLKYSLLKISSSVLYDFAIGILLNKRFFDLPKTITLSFFLKTIFSIPRLL